MIVGCGNKPAQDSAPPSVNPTLTDTREPPSSEPPATVIEVVDNDMPVDSDFEADDRNRRTADLGTVLEGKKAGSNISVQINITVNKLVGGPHTVVTVTGGTIIEPLDTQCKRVSRSEVDCDYGPDAETVQPLEVTDPIKLTIEPTAKTTDVTATSQATGTFYDTNPSNNIKTLTFTN